jgi:hypothetical protein
MLTPHHLIFDIIIYLGISSIFGLKLDFTILLIIFSANLIDLDHLFSRPIYDSKRNPFKKHFLHKNWIALIVLFLSLSFFYHKLIFVCIGLLDHFFLDYIKVRCI